ncbi:hypothetical protein [Actinacidiphila glaucinigra]|uniref:hypothetical protein n=1 Tax=Actinacidiphila glaucinigra TaxID=235986 RepID=UPI00366F4679
MAEARVGMNYTDEAGVKRKLWQSGADRLAYVAQNAPVGRLQTPKPWQTNEVRAFQDQELWVVHWVEPGDDDRRGGWVIIKLTDKGQNLLAEWQRVVEQGGGARGPKRGTKKGE